MKKVRLGRTNLKVSRVGIGGIPLQRPSEKDAIEVIKHAVDNGINIIDTSIGYGNSEERIGKALVGRRDDVILITRTSAADKKRAAEHIEQSLKNLQTDFIDIYELHNFSTPERYQAAFSEGGIMEAVYDAQAKGKIGHIGFTSHCINTVKMAVKSEIFDVILFPFNFINNEAEEELLPITKKLDIGFTAMKPFAGGRLTEANLVLKYLLQFDNVVPVPGVEKKEEINEILEIVNGTWNITLEEEQRMDNIRKELSDPFCQWCGYCAPGCPQEIYMPFVINAESMWKLWPHESNVKRYKDILVAAKTCTDCGECEEKCPYNLPVRDLMEKGIEYLESKITI